MKTIWTRIKSFFFFLIHCTCNLCAPSPTVREPRKIDVGEAKVTIFMKGDPTKHFVILRGTYIGPHPFGGDYVLDAEDLFARWREAGKSGTISLPGNRYVPLCNVETIDVEYFEHLVEVPL